LDYQILNFLILAILIILFVSLVKVFAQDEIIDAITVGINPFGMTYSADMVICMRQSSVQRRACKSYSNVLCLEDFNRME
jgi:predicted lysophospholipase L1 biosynthesis ABC-type transport system permease subunit